MWHLSEEKKYILCVWISHFNLHHAIEFDVIYCYVWSFFNHKLKACTNYEINFFHSSDFMNLLNIYEN